MLAEKRANEADENVIYLLSVLYTYQIFMINVCKTTANA